MATWDEDQEDAIIQYVREHPCFYDQKSPDYKNRDLRSAEWENLAGKFDVSVDVMKAKWKALNDSFNRCLMTKSSVRSGDGATAKVKWVHFDKMQFLAPFRTARKTQTTLVAVDVEKTPEQVDLTQSTDDSDATPKSDPPAKISRMGPPTTPVAKKKKLPKSCESPLDEAFKATLASITEQMNKPPTETQLFVDHIGTQLDKLPARRQLRAKDAIQRIVSQALDEQYGEEEAARAQPSGSQSWNAQILPPTQQTQYSEHFYPPHPSLLSNSPPSHPPEDSDEAVSYPVEEFLDERFEAGHRFILVKWIGYDAPTWEPIENIDDCEELLKVFNKEADQGFDELDESSEEDEIFENYD